MTRVGADGLGRRGGDAGGEAAGEKGEARGESRPLACGGHGFSVTESRGGGRSGAQVEGTRRPGPLTLVSCGGP